MLIEIASKLKPKQNFPLNLLRYLVTELNYGGKLTDKTDNSVLNEIVKSFIHPRVIYDELGGIIGGYYKSGE